MLLASISHDLVTMGIPVAEKLARTVGVYGGLLVLLRVGGKRDLAQLNTFDLVVLLLLSNVVQNAIIGADNSLVGGLIGAAGLLAVNSFVVRVAQTSARATRILEGTPTVLVREGRYDEAAIAREGLRPTDVMMAIQRQGVDALEDVKLAVLEPNGIISVKLVPGAHDATEAHIDRLEAKLDRLLAIAEKR
jgi:uncharacterized membrane protein YcaP (DUF421 family)